MYTKGEGRAITSQPKLPNRHTSSASPLSITCTQHTGTKQVAARRAKARKTGDGAQSRIVRPAFHPSTARAPPVLLRCAARSPCCPSNASVGKARLGRGAGEGGRGAQGGAACTEAQQLLVESNGLCAIHGLDLAPSSFRGPLLEFFNSTNGIPRGMYCSDYLFKLLLIGDSGVGKSVSVTCSMCQRIERCWHGALIRPAFHIWVDPVQSANSACCCDSRTTPTRRATSPPSVSTSKFGPSIWMVRPTVRCRVCLFARSG